MLITFKTKSYANIMMFGEVALKLLKMMDFGVSVPGGIIAEDVPQALSNLQRQLESVIDVVEPADDAEDDQPAVSLHTRALPLIELLQSAVADQNNVRWE
ncbi:MAG: DUF1840 domain-containing protein [Gammaproteobacteria bacterium]|nr:DUF1840 domain-containing protein [Gammaproteobacteria bacterium]